MKNLNDFANLKNTKIEIISITRIAPRKEDVKVLINGVEYFGYIITLGENWTKKYVKFLRKSYGTNQANYRLKMELENHLNN